MAPLPLDAVQIFVAVVRARSFRGAARALGLSKSTVSAKIAALEDQLEARLLERTTRSVRVTEVGERFYERAAHGLDVLRDAEAAVGVLRSAPSGRLRVTAPVELGQMIFGEIVAEYLQRYSSVEVEIELTDRRVDLVKEGFDLALRAGPLSDSSLVARKIGRPAETLLFASPRYLARRGAPRRPADLRDHECLVMSAHRRPAVWTFAKGQRTYEIPVRSRVRVNSFVVLRELAVAGHGIMRAPVATARRDLDQGLLQPLLADYAPPPTQLCAVFPSSRNAAPKLRAFLEIVDAWFAGDRLRLGASPSGAAAESGA